MLQLKPLQPFKHMFSVLVCDSALRSESVWWCATMVTWIGRRCTLSWAAAILRGSSTATRCISARTATSSSGRWARLSSHVINPAINTAIPWGLIAAPAFVFLRRRTQATRARPTTPKAAPRRCRLKILSICLISDSPLPAKNWVNPVNTVHKCVKYYVWKRDRFPDVCCFFCFFLRYDCKRLRQRDNYAIRGFWEDLVKVNECGLTKLVISRR